MTDRTSRTDREIDDLLEALATPTAAPDLDALRARLFPEPAPALSPRPRRTRRLVVAATVVACTAAGAVGAAAGGVFDSQVEKAFSRTVSAGYEIDADSITERTIVTTPDGGRAALYSASGHTDDGGPASCLTVLTTDPGVTPAGKPYRPQGGCSAGDGSATDVITIGAGVDWYSTDGSRWKVLWGRTDPSAVSAVFTDVSGTAVTTPVTGGYLLAFVAETTPEQGLRGMTLVDAAGTRTVLSTPVPYQGG